MNLRSISLIQSIKSFTLKAISMQELSTLEFYLMKVFSINIFISIKIYNRSIIIYILLT